MIVSSSLPHAVLPATVPLAGRALVFGGGGATGNAWLVGVVAGLAEAGLDVLDADLTIGTSAGSTAAAQFTAAAPAELYAAAIAGSGSGSGSARPSGRSQAGPRPPMTDHLAAFQAVIASSADAADMRRRMGAAALAADDGTDAGGDAARSARWSETVAARLGGARWPDRRMLITAVDARTGEPVTFERDSGVDLVDAVAASCAGGAFAYAIGDGRYIDGGYRSFAENADLAAGYERVLVLSPLGGMSRYPEEWGLSLATQVAALRAGGSRVEVIAPDAEDAHLFANPTDFTLRVPAAHAGRAQGMALPARLEDFWGSSAAPADA